MFRIENAAAGLGLLALALLAPLSAAGGLLASPDVTVELGGLILPDESVLDDDLAGSVSRIALGNLPADVDVEGVHFEAGTGDLLLAFDSSVVLPGGVEAEPRDVVRFDGVGYSLELDGSAYGLPPDGGIDALTRLGGGLLVSFDTTVALGPLIAADEDLVHLGGSGPTLFLDASALAVPVPHTLDLDAVHHAANGRLLVSFDSAGNFAGFDFADEDVLEIDPATGTWSLVFDGSAAATPWPSTSDLDAVALPEPRAALGLTTGILLLALLGSRRR